MSDAYYRDTKSALTEFSSVTASLSGVINKEYLDVFDTLENEVDGLLSMYADLLSELESAKELLEEYENQ